jgi:CheY-like chemotaxis protein
MQGRTKASVRRILVVDHDQETREAIESLLRRDGYAVYGATDEIHAIERMQWNQPHLLLVSLAGPWRHVISEARRIRSEAGASLQTPIVVYSESTLPVGTEVHIGKGVHLVAPDNFNQIRALLTRLLESTSQED